MPCFPYCISSLFAGVSPKISGDTNLLFYLFPMLVIMQAVLAVVYSLHRFLSPRYLTSHWRFLHLASIINHISISTHIYHTPKYRRRTLVVSSQTKALYTFYNIDCSLISYIVVLWSTMVFYPFRCVALLSQTRHRHNLLSIIASANRHALFRNQACPQRRDDRSSQIQLNKPISW